MPQRKTLKEVTFKQCMPDQACLDEENFKSLIEDIVNTDAYVKQLENLLHGLAEPVKP